MCVRRKVEALRGRSGISVYFVVGAVAILFVLLTGAVFTLPAQLSPSESPQQEIPLMQGAELFHAFCAPCHGLSGNGDGPVAAALKDHTPDLTRLPAENGGTFPSARLKAVIRNEDGPVAHGTAQMPVWGPLFQAVSSRENKKPSKLKVIKESGISNSAIAELRVSNLIDYIQTLQVDSVK